MALNRGYGADMQRSMEKPTRTRSTFLLLMGCACAAIAIIGYSLSDPPSFWLVGLAMISFGLWDQQLD